jgi:hypothetical protein
LANRASHRRRDARPPPQRIDEARKLTPSLDLVFEILHRLRELMVETGTAEQALASFEEELAHYPADIEERAELLNEKAVYLLQLGRQRADSQIIEQAIICLGEAIAIVERRANMPQPMWSLSIYRTNLEKAHAALAERKRN